MNVMLAIVSIVFVLCAVGGLAAGFLRKASGILSFLLAGAIVTALLPSAASWLRTGTPLYTFLQEQCALAGETIARNTVKNGIGALTGESGETAGSGNHSDDGGNEPRLPSPGDASVTDSLFNDDGSVNRTYVKSLLQQYGYDSSVIDGMSDDQIRSLIRQYGGVSAGVMSLTCSGGRRNADASFQNGSRASSQTDAFSRHGGRKLSSSGEHGRFADLMSGSLPGQGRFADLISASGSGKKRTADLVSASVSGQDAGEKGGPSQTDADSALSALLDNMSASEERRFIETLPIPDALQEQLETFNNSEGYRKLGAGDFASYVTSYFASLILNIIAYFVTLLVAWALIRLIFRAAGIFTRLPVIRTVDHVLGLAVGLLQGLLLVWTLFLILSFFSATPAGKTLIGQIYDSPFLEMLYNSNLFLKSASSGLKGIL